MSDSRVDAAGPDGGNPIDRCFEQLAGRTALILYVTAGHPNPRASLELAPVVARQADIIEIGIPFSDPVADGPVIQASSQTALEQGTRLEHCFDLARTVWTTTGTPVVFLTYYNPVLKHGLGRFASDSAEAGVAGVMVPDLPVEESALLRQALSSHGIHLIPLVTPTGTDARLKMACDVARGFVYCVSRTGVTGARQSLEEGLPNFLSRIGELTKTPRAVGFGISTREQAAKTASLAEGVIVGSALVDLISRSPEAEVANRAEEFARDLRAGIMERG